jgi:hypothetical protein
MKCVTKKDGYDILREIHKGVCGNHATSRTLVGKAFRADFWWPTAVTDAEDLVQRCQNCQFFGKQSHVPAHSLITIPPSWSFACWSLDMIEPFTTALGDFTHVFVAIDKFTKWIEYKPIAKITPDRVVDFISDILHRFGFLNTIITDLGSNFTANQFRASRKDFMMKTARKEESGYTSYHMSSAGSGLSHPKPQDKLHSFSSTTLKLSYRPTSCENPHGLKCTMKARRTKRGS